jgi:hypothetical protein
VNPKLAFKLATKLSLEKRINTEVWCGRMTHKVLEAVWMCDILQFIKQIICSLYSRLSAVKTHSPTQCDIFENKYSLFSQ